MRDATARARGALLWIVPFAIVVAALGFETDWGSSVGRVAPAPPATPAQPLTVALLPEYTINGGLETRKETVDRVLFNPTRRPAPPAVQGAAGPSTMKRGLYTLTGTTVVGNVATAFLREVNGGKSRSVRKGETVGGMLVADVGADRVRLKQGDEFEELQLKIATGPRTTVQPAVVAPAPVPGQPARAQPGAAPTAAGGSVGPSSPGAARPLPRPAAPPASAPPPPAATTTSRTGGSVSVSELLAERRRAARAAAEAAAAGRSPVAPGQPR